MTSTKRKVRWDPAPPISPLISAPFPTTRVIGEIKPHNAAGIRAGIAQLRTRHGYTTKTPQLITYRQKDGDATRYDVFAADSRELRSVLRRDRPGIATWHRLGTIQSARAIEPIPRWQCPTALGVLLEPQIRRMYAARAGITLDKKSGHRTGADIEHELFAEFLLELATELRAQPS